MSAITWVFYCWDLYLQVSYSTYSVNVTILGIVMRLQISAAYGPKQTEPLISDVIIARY